MAEIYNTDRFAELYYPSNTAEIMQLGLAARFITDLLERYHITYAFIGGWAVYLRGASRTTRDIDISVTTSMDRLREILMAQPRIHFPAIHGRTSVQIFIDVGRTVDRDFPHVPDLAVSMDVVISGETVDKSLCQGVRRANYLEQGNLGTPADLGSSRESISPSWPTPQGSPVLVLGLFFQIYAKLDAFARRGGEGSNDFVDLEFLFMTYASDIPSLREYYDLEQRRCFWRQYAATYASFPQQVENMRILLGL